MLPVDSELRRELACLPPQGVATGRVSMVLAERHSVLQRGGDSIERALSNFKKECPLPRVFLFLRWWESRSAGKTRALPFGLVL